MFARKVVTASAAALALAALAVPVVSAQGGGSDSGSLPVEGLLGGSLAGGSLAVDSAGEPDPDTEDGPGQSDGDPALGGGSGSAGSGGGDSSLPDLAPEDGAVCDLPELGGSVAKFYPLFGIDGIPAGVFDIVTSALDTFPNLLDIVAGEGSGTEILGRTGSLDEGLCKTIFGGQMVMPPVTVIVDGDGQPVTTVTGTVARAPQGIGAASSPASVTSVTSVPVAGAAESGTGDSTRVSAPADVDTGGARSALPTTVPVS